jgi:hypothetical protein
LKDLRNLPKRLSAVLAAVVLLFGVVFPLLLPQKALAANQLQQRSLKLSSSANGNITTDKAGNAISAGAGGNGQKTSEVFSFKLQTTGNVGSVLIVYCDDPIPEDPCTTPTGFDASHVASVTQSGWTGGAYSLDSATNLTTSPTRLPITMLSLPASEPIQTLAGRLPTCRITARWLAQLLSRLILRPK